MITGKPVRVYVCEDCGYKNKRWKIGGEAKRCSNCKSTNLTLLKVQEVIKK